MSRNAVLLLLCLALLAPLPARSQELSLSVAVEGVDDELRDNILGYLTIQQLAARDSLNVYQIRSAHRRAKDEIERALQPYGYYRPQVAASLKVQDAHWTARYRVDVGAATQIGATTITLNGAGDAETDLLAMLEPAALQPGQQLNHSEYSTFKDRLYNRALELGYLDAEYAESSIKVYIERDTADIALALDTGPQYRFGEIAIVQDILDQDLVERFNHIEYGEPFNTEKILELKLRLTNSGYFSSVESEVHKERAEADQHIPVTMIAIPAKPRKYLVGVGYGTDIGPRVSLGVQFRRVNRKGHKIHARASISQKEPRVTAQYIIPTRDVTRDQYAITASLLNKEYAQGDGDSKQYLLGVSQNIHFGNWTRRIYLNAQYDNFSIGNDGGISTLVIPGLAFKWLRLDDNLYARRAASLSFDVHGSVDAGFSDTNYINALASLGLVWGLTDRSRVLLKSQFGVVQSTDFNRLPPSERFFAGGDQSVRGYAYQSISPRDESGRRVGGRYLYTATAELDYLFYKDFGGAIFLDAGTATDDLADAPRKGVGFGLRWASPVGMARFDLAWPLDKDERNVRLHISIGPDL